jgi:hypothetical protein
VTCKVTTQERELLEAIDQILKLGDAREADLIERTGYVRGVIAAVLESDCSLEAAVKTLQAKLQLGSSANEVPGLSHG